MDRDIGELDSALQHRGALKTADAVLSRGSRLPEILAGQPRTLWYVLDEETGELPHIRAERGPGNRNRVRSITPQLLIAFVKDQSLTAANRLFISPYRAQAKLMAASTIWWTLLERIGEEHRNWVAKLLDHYPLSQVPIISKAGEMFAGPLLWIKAAERLHACFGKELPSMRTRQRLEDHGIAVLSLGQRI